LARDISLIESVLHVLRAIGGLATFFHQV